MAISHTITVYSQPSIYDPEPRTLDIYFSEPSAGVNADTGILMLSAGYGGNCNSKVFRKMRDMFADQYNYVTVQCDYMGYEFMGSISKEEAYNLLVSLTSESLGKDTDLFWSDPEAHSDLLKEKSYLVEMDLDETKANLNDMGPVQAMDHIIALGVLADILEQNGYSINKKRIHGYGFSHGAYLLLLCNLYMPGLFTGILDNSAYLIPEYLKGPRASRFGGYDQMELRVRYNYLIAGLIEDAEIYSLELLSYYRENHAQIIVYHGEEDAMTEIERKHTFVKQLGNATWIPIGKPNVDGEIFRNDTHGLGADFVKLFDYTMRRHPFQSDWEGLQFSNQRIDTDSHIYQILNEEGTYRLHVSNR